MKKERDYEVIAEFFYKRASDRVRHMVNKCNLKHRDILYPDPKQISRIINNNRQRNNKYLINNSALETSYIDENNKSVPCGLIPTLDFNSPKDVLWGTDAEIADYIHELFILLWDEVCVKDKQIDSELYLCDYVPYAKYRTYWKILFEADTINDPRFSFEEYNGKMLNFPALFFGIKEDDVIENIDSARDEALEYLYKRCKNIFLTDFINFTDKTDSFHMLNKTIKTEIIEGILIPMLEKNKPDASSLGLRVKNLILEDLSYSASLIFRRNIDNPEYRRNLINASSDYILCLEDIQKASQ